MARVVLAMSGGVDSSVAAYLLREQGHEVIGLFMRTGGDTSAHASGANNQAAEAGGTALPVLPARKQGCCSAADSADARRVADQLAIPFYALNFEREFGRIMDYFADEYLSGRTPNPCVTCNNWLKFGKLADFASRLDAEHLATGHYARTIATSGLSAPADSTDGQAGIGTVAPSVEADAEYGLFCGADPVKDQSYVLFGLERRLLSRLLFPIGGYRKSEIRDLARRIGLRVAEKPDSQEICFVPDGDHARFVRRRRPDRDTDGEVVDTAGNVVGRHDGIDRYTVGQRRGLRIAFGEPRYVVALNPETRRVVVGSRDELARHDLEADRVNWLVDAPTAPIRCQAKIRYQHSPANVTAGPLPGNRLRVVFDEPQYGVAPGQAVVLYDGPRVLGGGWIG